MRDGPSARVVGPIVPGCIVVLSGVEFEDDDGTVMSAVVEQFAAIAGHHEFVVLTGSASVGADVELWTLDDDLGEKVREALRRAGSDVTAA